MIKSINLLFFKLTGKIYHLNSTLCTFKSLITCLCSCSLNCLFNCICISTPNITGISVLSDTLAIPLETYRTNIIIMACSSSYNCTKTYHCIIFSALCHFRSNKWYFKCTRNPRKVYIVIAYSVSYKSVLCTCNQL